MIKPLSFAAQAVLKTSASAACLQHWGAVNDPPCHPSDDGWNGCGDCVHRSAIAAALRAAADQVVPEEEEPVPNEDSVVEMQAWARVSQRQRIRFEILAIAAELESHQ